MRAANWGTPLVHVERGYTEGFVKHCVGNTKRFHTLLKAGFRIFDRIVAVSDGQAQWLVDAGLVANEKLKTIQSCVDLKTFRYGAGRPTNFNAGRKGGKHRRRISRARPITMPPTHGDARALERLVAKTGGFC